MILNKYEHNKILNSNLPSSWQRKEELEELNEFLQQNWEMRSIFYEDKKIETNQQFLDITSFGDIKTKKYIGTIIFKGEQLNIYPRIFSTGKGDDNTENLSQEHLLKNIIKWIEYCNKFNYPFIKISSGFEDTNSLKELFITLYIVYVYNTIERNIYYQYIEETKDCKSIKGKFNLRNYFEKKIPSGKIDSFCCAYSKFEIDNKVNRIIKYTCKKLMNITSKKNQKIIRRILMRFNEVSDEICTPGDCDKIILNNKYKNYNTIISMSKMFLINKISNQNLDKNESFCFLFPTDLLFEGFIGGFLKEELSNFGGKVTLQESKMSLIERIIYKGEVSGPAFKMRHDILAELNGNIFILDTKYKELSRFDGNQNFVENIKREVKQSDLYQVLEYARKRLVNDVYLVYPMYRYESEESEFPVAVSDGINGSINIHFIRVPFVFEDDYKKTENKLKNTINSIFNIV